MGVDFCKCYDEVPDKDFNFRRENQSNSLLLNFTYKYFKQS